MTTGPTQSEGDHGISPVSVSSDPNAELLRMRLLEPPVRAGLIANLDVAVSTLATASALATAQTAITAIKAKTDNLPDGLPKNLSSVIRLATLCPCRKRGHTHSSARELGGSDRCAYRGYLKLPLPSQSGIHLAGSVMLSEKRRR